MKFIFVFLIVILTVSCTSNEPKPIKLNVDSCDFCKMTISNGKFASEFITTKGRWYKFDDLGCMLMYIKANPNVSAKSEYVGDYTKENTITLMPAQESFYLTSPEIKSPMKGNLAAFKTSAEQGKYQKLLNAKKLTWKQVITLY